MEGAGETWAPAPAPPGGDLAQPATALGVPPNMEAAFQTGAAQSALWAPPPAEPSDAPPPPGADAVRDAFAAAWSAFQERRGAAAFIPPTGRLAVDPWLLFADVVSRGGSALVTERKQWAQVGRPFSAAPTMSDLSSKIKVSSAASLSCQSKQKTANQPTNHSPN
jgi:hypothetical protein